MYRVTPADLATITEAYETLGRELERVTAEDRRRVCAVMVAGIARTSSAAVADLAACAAFTVLTVGGAK